jgi:phospholipid/cholesterol/gamma-HCH transport system permease protein
VVDLNFIEPSPDSFAERIGRVASSPAPFTWRVHGEADELRLELGGSFTIEQAPALWNRVAQVLERKRRLSRVNVDLSGVEAIDGSCIALLVHLQTELRQRRVTCEFERASPDTQRLLTLYGRRRFRRRRPPRRATNAIAHIGQAMSDWVAAALGVFDFLGEFLVAVFTAIKHPRSLNLRDVTLTMERSGADAVPIVLLINFLVGFVMAYQSAEQLEQFGANIFVADLVGLAMVRELGPLMTAIIVCGRSGAAFAAELGTMKVSEEVDALRTLGVLPLRYLVLPRVLGLTLVGPVLTLAADAVGVGGGIVVAATQLDVTPAAFMGELRQVMEPWDVISGLLKSVVFSATIAIIACQRGLGTGGGAEGVGRQTTSAVVITLFALILLDAVFTVIFGVFA